MLDNRILLTSSECSWNELANVFLKLRLKSVSYKKFGGQPTEVPFSEFKKYNTYGGLRRFNPARREYSPAYLLMADPIDYETSNFSTAFLLDPTDIYLPPQDPQLIYSFEYELSFEMEQESYVVEHERIHVTIDLYPSLETFVECNLKKLTYTVGVGEYYNLHCLKVGFTGMGHECEGGASTISAYHRRSFTGAYSGDNALFNPATERIDI